MCLAIPGKVLEVKDQEAKIDFGDMQKDVFLGHVKAEVGDYILVGAGMAVAKIDETILINWSICISRKHPTKINKRNISAKTYYLRKNYN